MPVWLVVILGTLAKQLIPVAINILEKSGVINSVEAYGIKAGTHVIQTVESIKTYPDYTGLGDK